MSSPLTTVGLIAAMVPAAALAGPCAPRDQVVAQLAAKYGETRHSMGLAPNNAVFEVFASDASGTWTILVTSAAGVTCLMASGEAFEQVIETLPPQGSKL